MFDFCPVGALRLCNWLTGGLRPRLSDLTPRWGVVEFEPKAQL